MEHFNIIDLVSIIEFVTLIVVLFCFNRARCQAKLLSENRHELMDEVWKVRDENAQLTAFKNKLLSDRQYFIQLNDAEIQSGLTRIRWAENLIKQLPPNHDGRNSWLLNYGVTLEAQKMRYTRLQKDSRIVWNDTTESLNPVS